MKITSTKITVFIAIIIVVIFLWQSLGDLFISYPLRNYPPKNPNVLVWGDSLSVGVGAENKEDGYLPVLEKRLSFTAVNKAVSGETTESALAHAQKDIADTQPGIVLILLGGNDILLGTPKETTFKNLRTLIDIAEASGAAVNVVGIQKHVADGYGEGFETVAKEAGALLTPNILDGILTESSLMSDEVHPNARGYLKMADKIAPTLESLILLGTKDKAAGAQ